MMTAQTEPLVETNTKPWFKNASVWFSLAFLVGLFLRLGFLEGMVYAQNELELINQALQISRGMSTTTSAVPAYTGLTGVMFFLLGANNFLARLFPALIGASLILLPALWKEKLGTRTALILSIALALDPTYLLFSRAVNGGIFAIAGVLWSFTCLRKNKPILAGICAALAFLSGQVFWSILIVLVVTWLLIKTVRPDLLDEFRLVTHTDQKINWLEVLLGFIAFAVLTLTSFFLNPSGLSGLASSVIGSIDNFTHSFDKALYHTIYIQIAHSYLPFTLFILGYIRIRKSRGASFYNFGGASIIITMILCMVLSRESFELTLIPVLISWIGGAFWLAQLELEDLKPWGLKPLLAVFVITILIFIKLNISRLIDQPVGSPQFWNVFLMIIAGIVLLITAWWLVRFSWSTTDTSRVFLVTLLVFLAIITLGKSFRSLKADQQIASLEYLDNYLVLPNNDIEMLIRDFELSGRSLQQAGDFALQNLPDGYAWHFRDFGIARNHDDVSIVMSRSESLLQEDEEFRGTNVVLERTVDWRNGPGVIYLQALAGKKPVLLDQKGVLWVRLNLFTGASQ